MRFMKWIASLFKEDVRRRGTYKTSYVYRHDSKIKGDAIVAVEEIERIGNLSKIKILAVYGSVTKEQIEQLLGDAIPTDEVDWDY